MNIDNESYNIYYRKYCFYGHRPLGTQMKILSYHYRRVKRYYTGECLRESTFVTIHDQIINISTSFHDPVIRFIYIIWKTDINTPHGYHCKSVHLHFSYKDLHNFHFS